MVNILSPIADITQTGSRLKFPPRVSLRCSPGHRPAPQIANQPTDHPEQSQTIKLLYLLPPFPPYPAVQSLLLRDCAYQCLTSVNPCTDPQPAAKFRLTLSSVASSASPEDSMGRPLAVNSSTGKSTAETLVSSALSILSHGY